MLGLLVSFDFTLLSGFIVTLVTAIHNSFMLGLLVLGQNTLFTGFIVVLVTSVQYSICCISLSHFRVMLRHNMSVKNIRRNATVVTFFTAKPLIVGFGKLVHSKVDICLTTVCVGCHEATGSFCPGLCFILTWCVVINSTCLPQSI
jgi:hypothetical protein